MCPGLSPNAQQLGTLISWAEKNKCLTLSRKSEFALSPPFCSIQALNRLDDAHLYSWGWSLHNLLIQMLISSRNTFTDIPKIMFYQLPGHLSVHGPLIFTHKISHQHHIRKIHSRIIPWSVQRCQVVPVLSPGLPKQQNNPCEERAQGAWHVSAYPSLIDYF